MIATIETTFMNNATLTLDTLNQRTQDTQAASDLYDTATGHGASQGAVLNTSIK